ncbi:MAG: thiamine ABC transporter substrate-binding protein [Chloroflexi bacterium]|nr:thiamine ABC transporter substrate-binding protein [Chloroflexota bacterium]
MRPTTPLHVVPSRATRAPCTVRRSHPLARLALAVAVLALTAGCGSDAAAPRTLVVLTHDSFDMRAQLLEAYEREHDVKVTLLKGGDANAVVNRAILNAGRPEADVLYGVDNLTFARTAGKGLFDDFTATRRAQIPDDVRAQFGDSHAVTPIGVGYVALNFDRAQGQPPARFEELTQQAWRGKLVVEDPTTSSPGLQFLATTVAYFGESGAYTWREYWRELRRNHVLVADGWDTAYNTHFTRNGGDRPLVVSYTTSPAAEVFFSEGALKEPPTMNVLPAGARLFRQVEAAGVLAGARQPELARAFVNFMLRDEFQRQIPETMFVYPVIPGIETPDWWRWARIDVQPAPLSVDAATVERWLREWSEVMRR